MEDESGSRLGHLLHGHDFGDFVLGLEELLPRGF
jgi:hypothetical protein